MDIDIFFNLLGRILAVIIALSIHEFAHGYIAYKNGDFTPKLYGRLTLNPLAHFDLLGTILLIFCGFGWAKPVPINPSNFKNYKKGVFSTSIAGVTANYILAFISFGIYALNYFCANAIFAYTTDSVLFIAIDYIAYWIFVIDISLFLFNLLPVYPLDGFRVVESFAKPNNAYCEFMRKWGFALLIGLLLLGTVFTRYDLIGLYMNTAGYYISWPIQKFWIWVFGL